jgi:hypothetical protein
MKKCKSTRAFRILRSGLIVLVVGGVLGPPACVSPLAASSVQAAEAPAGYFPTLPPHAALPSAAACASAVLSTPASAELRPANAAANHTVPTPEQLTAFHAFPVKGSFCAAVGLCARGRTVHGHHGPDTAMGRMQVGCG